MTVLHLFIVKIRLTKQLDYYVMILLDFTHNINCVFYLIM